ncbi:MAG: thioredoxin, partial [Planctomycetes bacterium]|nr:thioredoxin [Planctomycetota bacterium]
MAASKHVYDANDASFETAVLHESTSRPVLVDFWAAWCGPCRMLGPTIEAVVESYGGRVALARLNVDENRASAARYGIQSIPAVKMFVDGKVVEEFVGARDASFIRSFIDRNLPSPQAAGIQAAEEMLDGGNPAAAMELVEPALASEPVDPAALIVAARACVQLDRLDSARDYVSKIPPGTGQEEARRSVASLISLMDRASLVEINGRTDLDKAFADALRFIRKKQFAPALEALISIISRDKTYRNGEPKSLVLSI